MRALILAFITAFVIAPLTAQAAESHVYIYNVSDKSVWITAFTSNCTFEIHGAEKPGTPGKVACLGSSTERHIVHEWCVPPFGKLDKHGFHVALTVVHVLVTYHQGCGRPILKDWTMQFPRNNGSQSITQEYRITTTATSNERWYHIETVPK